MQNLDLFIIISMIILLFIVVTWCIVYYEIKPYQEESETKKDFEYQKEEFEHIDVRICQTPSVRSILEETKFI